MSVITVEVNIDHGKITARDPEKLPAQATGILTVIALPPTAKKKRISLPMIHGDGKHFINPTPEELDASAWGD